MRQFKQVPRMTHLGHGTNPLSRDSARRVRWVFGDGGIGMSAIDGLIAALVAAPSFVRPDEWVPLIFAGRPPAMHENSFEHRAQARR